MTVSILNECLLIKDEPFLKLQEYLQSINLAIFDAIISSYEPKEAKQIILYILTAYSEESPMVIVRQDSQIEKSGICDFLGIEDIGLRTNLFNLTDQNVRHATTNYLLQFAGPLFRSLKFLEIQRDDFMLNITNRAYVIRKEETKDATTTVIETPDVKEHGKAIAEHARICKSIEAIEKEIKNNSTYKAIALLKEFRFQHIDKKANVSKESAAVEGSKLITIGAIHGQGTRIETPDKTGS